MSEEHLPAKEYSSSLDLTSKSPNLQTDDLPVAIAHCDGDRRIKAGNPALFSLLGQSLQKLRGQVIDTLLRREKSVPEAVIGSRCLSTTFLWVDRADGGRNRVCLKERKTDAGWIIQLVEVDELVAEFDDLAYRESIWRNATVASGHGVWDYNATTGVRFFSRGWKRMRGLPEDEEFEDSFAAWKSRIHRDDLDYVEAQSEAQNDGKLPDFSFEYRERRTDGKWVWIMSRGRVVEWDEAGMPARMTGCDVDITALKEAESIRGRDLVLHNEQLFEQNQRFDAAISTMSHGLAMFDQNHNIIISNEQYATIYGLGIDQVRAGMSLEDVMELRLARGCFGGTTPEEYRREIARCGGDRSGKPRQFVLNDGRYVEIRDHKMDDGGWLSVHEDVTERYTSANKIKYLADYDTLTGLPNRAQIHDILQTALKECVRSDTKLALLYIDLDGFKEVNDTLGHPVGDHVLNEVGARLNLFLGDTIIAGRLSGDEFVMIVKDYGNFANLRTLSSGICTSIARTISVGQNEIDISASIGIAVGPPEDGQADTLIQFSDLALYQAKSDGGKCYRFFEKGMYTKAKERQRMAADLRNAIRDDELLLHYQPQIDLLSGKIVGYEALVRWQHCQLGMISPFQFIGLAEETGQISEIGEWVLRTACTYAAGWENEETISVNLSPVQFKRQDIVTMVKRILWETGLKPERLELEITESVLIQSTDSVIITLRTLAEMGVSIALDDFGTGYSSLSYLTTFPFNKIKIDKSFVDKLGTDTEGSAIIDMIVGLGRSLDTVIIAEGIEDEAQHSLLVAAGCNQGQGYLYGKPLPQILTAKSHWKSLRA